MGWGWGAEFRTGANDAKRRRETLKERDKIYSSNFSISVSLLCFLNFSSSPSSSSFFSFFSMPRLKFNLNRAVLFNIKL